MTPPGKRRADPAVDAPAVCVVCVAITLAVNVPMFVQDPRWLWLLWLMLPAFAAVIWAHRHWPVSEACQKSVFRGVSAMLVAWMLAAMSGGPFRTAMFEATGAAGVLFLGGYAWTLSHRGLFGK